MRDMRKVRSQKTDVRRLNSSPATAQLTLLMAGIVVFRPRSDEQAHAGDTAVSDAVAGLVAVAEGDGAVRRIRLASKWHGIVRSLVLEKIPFFVLSAISCVVTFIVQQKGGAVVKLARIPMTGRIENAFVSYARYLGKTLWPAALANPYPHPGHWEFPLVIYSVALVAGLSAIAVLFARKFPFFFTGWFWFVGTLVPVIGLVQVGGAVHGRPVQLRAPDRVVHDSGLGWRGDVVAAGVGPNHSLSLWSGCCWLPAPGRPETRWVIGKTPKHFFAMRWP